MDRGGKVLFVDHFEDNGQGSLRAAVEDTVGGNSFRLRPSGTKLKRYIIPRHGLH
jgi:hypothetical protein